MFVLQYFVYITQVSNNSRFNEFWQSNYESINEKTNLLFHSSHSWLEVLFFLMVMEHLEKIARTIWL